MKFLLTFDLEGPTNINNSVLSLLEKEEFDCIFFVEGKWAEKFKRQVSYVSDNFILGNHSYSHPDFRKLDLNQQVLEIKKCDIVLSKIKKQKVRVFRAPFCKSNKKTFFALKQMNYDFDSSIQNFLAKKPTKVDGIRELYVNTPSDFFLFKIMRFSDKVALSFMKKILLYHQLLDSVVVFDFHPTQRWGIYSHIKFFEKFSSYLKESFIAYNL